MSATSLSLHVLLLGFIIKYWDGELAALAMPLDLSDPNTLHVCMPRGT